MKVLDHIKAHREEILSVAKRCGLTDVKVFGSVVRREERSDSDVDFLVDLLPDHDPLGFVDFQQEVSQIINRPVDIVFKNGVHPLLQKRIEEEAKPL